MLSHLLLKLFTFFCPKHLYPHIHVCYIVVFSTKCKHVNRDVNTGTGETGTSETGTGASVWWEKLTYRYSEREQVNPISTVTWLPILRLMATCLSSTEEYIQNLQLSVILISKIQCVSPVHHLVLRSKLWCCRRAAGWFWGC